VSSKGFWEKDNYNFIPYKSHLGDNFTKQAFAKVSSTTYPMKFQAN